MPIAENNTDNEEQFFNPAEDVSFPFQFKGGPKGKIQFFLDFSVFALIDAEFIGFYGINCIQKLYTLFFLIFGPFNSRPGVAEN